MWGHAELKHAGETPSVAVIRYPTCEGMREIGESAD